MRVARAHGAREALPAPLQPPLLVVPIGMSRLLA